MKLFGIYILLSALFIAPADAYFGAKSREFSLKFQGQIDTPLSASADLQQLNREGSTARKNALADIEWQIRHLRGAMQSKFYLKKFPFRGVVGEGYSIRFLAQAPAASAGRQLLTYEFSGKLILDKKFLEMPRSAWREFPILMPFQPDQIYKTSMGSARRNFCMPAGITGEGEFWYYWDLSLPNCSLLKDKQISPDLFANSAEIQPLAETKKTCPQYSKLYSGSELKIAAFYGYVNTIKKHTRVNYNDPNYQSMKGFEEQLERWGFSKDKERSFDRMSVNRKKGIAYHHIWLGSLTFKRKKMPVEVKVVLADTDASSEDDTFHELIKPALRDSNIIIYDGHAGDDSHLNLSAEGLGVRHLPRDLYQIFFFNACYTYPYYNSMYFDAKGSRDNLEIITTGQETDTSMSVRNMRDFLEPFLFPKNSSYQEILNTMESHIPQSVGTALYGVNGDEGKSCD